MTTVAEALEAPVARRARPVSDRAAQGAGVARSRLVVLLGLFIVLMGTLARFQGLDRYALEQDELYTVQEATELWDTTLQPGIKARPLYFLVQHVLLDLFPATPFAIRLPAFVFGVMALVLTWRAGSRLFGPVAGLGALTLLAISPWHIHASGMARYWSSLYLLAIGGFYLLVRALESGRGRDYAGALVCFTLGMFTHPTFAFPMLGVAVGSALVGAHGRLRFPWPDRDALLRLWIPLGLIVGIGAAVLMVGGDEGAVRNWAGRGWLSSLRLVPAMVDWMTPSLVCAAGIGALWLAVAGRTAVRRRWGWMTLLGAGGAVALLAVASLTTDVYADYAMAAFPLLVVSAGGLLQLVWEAAQSRGAAVAGALAGVVVVGMAPSTASHLSDGTRFDYRPAYRYIGETDATLPVVTWPLHLQRYYAPELNAYHIRANRDIMDGYLADHGALWVVASVRRYGIATDDFGTIAGWLAEHCQLEMAHERPRFDYRRYRVEVHRCRVRPAAAIGAS
jgi:hypothetical protein